MLSRKESSKPFATDGLSGAKRDAQAVDEFGGVGLRVTDHMWPVKTNAYQMLKTTDALTQRYEGLQVNLAKLVKDSGLGAAIYTQITDVEHEVNGFLTFDRKVEKMDFSRVKTADDLVFKAVDERQRGKLVDSSGR